jgi:anti-sigma B factor antagonist
VELKVEEEGGVCFITPEGQMLAGEGDVRLKQELDRLRSQGKVRVVVDLAAVPYIDSSVLGQLAHGFSLLKKEGGALKLVNPSKRVTDLLSLTRLISVFQIYRSRQEAVDAWPSPK